MSGKIEIFGMTDVGQERTHNEDNFVICQDLQIQEWQFRKGQEVTLGQQGALLMVADGMGGANAGEVASDIAQKTVKEIFSALNGLPDNIPAFLKRSIITAHQAIVQHANANSEYTGMGTTAVLAWLIDSDLYVAWSGDSRCYVQSDGVLKQIGKDHSMVAEMVAAGQISEEEAWDHPNGNIITQSLGDPGSLPRPDVARQTLKTGDRVVVCSDGLNGMLRDARINQILSEGMPTAETCRKLVNEANIAGGHDNITVLMLDAKELLFDEPTTKGAVSGMTHSQMTRKVSRKNIIIAALAALLIGFIGFELYSRWEKNNQGNASIQGATTADSTQNTELERVEEPDTANKPPTTNNPTTITDRKAASKKKAGGTSSSTPKEEGITDTSPPPIEITDQDTLNPQKGNGLQPIGGGNTSPNPILGGNSTQLEVLAPTIAECKKRIEAVIELKAVARQRLACIALHATSTQKKEANEKILLSDKVLKEIMNDVIIDSKNPSKVKSLRNTSDKARYELGKKIEKWDNTYKGLKVQADRMIEEIKESRPSAYNTIQECLK